MIRQRSGWAVVIFANVVILCMLGFYRAGEAAPTARQPFANSVGQRQEMVEQLKEMNRLLKQQNALLKSGSLRVIVVKQEE